MGYDDMKRKLAVVLALVCTLCLGNPLWAQAAQRPGGGYGPEDGHGPDGGFGPGGYDDYWCDDCDDYGYDDYGYDDYDDYDYSGSGSSQYDYVTWETGLGSAGELSGKTIIVSMFVNDKHTSWDMSASEDQTRRSNTLTYLGIATDYIVENAARYGVTAEFVYDWQENPSLYFEGTINYDIVNSDDFDTVSCEFIEANVDTETLKTEFGAENIIYMFYLHTSSRNQYTSCTYNYYDGLEYDYEMCFIYTYCDGEEEAPAAYAHEILHTFGAPDLYTEDYYGDNYGITRQFVRYIESNYANEIMYTTYDINTSEMYYDHISNEITDLTAYYVGWVDSSDVATEWGLQPSQHTASEVTQ